ncbi:hypothetical protein B0T24DRAFT_719330 [Lasiosphaeria ovina]|uniref:Protein kinase domain-containing protein n=1 Tax=Lasiosphaeria ovina TaxID=92902 RepID=A0AAE0KJG1_9PEZI|nr:hypothetical protein B0T24DRAFT_719330 [Lasiosphaeria ovina]
MASTVKWIGPDLRKQGAVTYRDSDTLRYLSVWVKWDDDERIVTAILPGLFASLAPDVQGIDMTPSGELLVTTTDRRVVRSREPYYLSVAEYGLSSGCTTPQLPVVPRSKLAVLKRMAMGVDQVSYTDPESGQERVAALKFPFRDASFVGGGLWADIHILGRLPPHPNVVSMDALVVEEISAGARSFKLKWLREIILAVDFLNLECSVMHCGLVAVNIFVNTATDSAVLIDLGMGKSARQIMMGGTRHQGSPTSVDALKRSKPASGEERQGQLRRRVEPW